MEEFKLILLELKNKLIKGIRDLAEAFIKSLWEYLKAAVIESIKKSLDLLKELVKSEAGQQKKEFILDIVMSKIELPFLLKPFRGLIKKFLANKIEETVVIISK